MINQTTFSVLNQAIAETQDLLTTYAFGDELLSNFTTAFGDNYDRAAAEDLVTQWQKGEFDSFPEIEIRSSAEINGANGAYSVDTNKIYIAEEFLLANVDNQGAIVDLVLEEYGHYVDAQINSVDAAGDEGDIFAGLVQGQSFTDEQLQLLKAENDLAVVTIDGEKIAIEQATAGNDTINGSLDDDIWFGGRGNDSLDGGQGNDLLYGDLYTGTSAWQPINGSGVALDNLRFGDFNGDGTTDILTKFNPASGAVEPLRVSYGGTTGWQNLITTGVALDNLRFGDFNGDGKTDILTKFNPASGAVEPLRVSYGGTTGWQNLITTGVALDIMRFGDFNGDGATDILTKFNPASGSIEPLRVSFSRESKGGDDTLIGGAGNDTLAGGTGTNHLSGGEGIDTFVIESGGIQIIEDFERGNDKIDITASGAQEISLAPNNGNTNVINQSNITLATIQGQTLTTEDLILISDSEQQSLFPTLSVSEQNITGLIKEWGDKFAQQQDSSIAGNIDMSGVNFELTNLDYQQSVEIPSTAISVSNIWRNTTGNSGTQTIEVNNEKTLERTITTENQISISQTNGVSTNSNFSVSSSVTASAKVSVGVYEGGVEATVGASAEYGITQDFENTFERVLNQSRSLSESTTSGITQTQEIPVSPQTVLYNDIITYNGTSNVPIKMSYSVDGDLEFSLDNGNSYTVPINAILQHYDLLDGQLDTFQPEANADLLGTDFDGNGTSLFYAETLNFDLVGSLELQSTFSQTTTSSVTDVLLNGSLVNGNSLAGLEIIRDELGAPVQVRYTANAEDERLWIVKDSLTSNMEYDMITGFDPGNDKIAISHNQIDAIDDLNISYSGGNADIHFGDQHLARLNGIDANSLDSSDFVFSTQGTVFDESITSV